LDKHHETFINIKPYLILMKRPKEANRYCKHCKKHTSHKVSEAKRKGMGSVHTQAKGQKKRVRKRGQWRGAGNQGRYSRPAMAARKMTGKKQSKKTDIRYTCKDCKKVSTQKSGFRTKRLEFQ